MVSNTIDYRVHFDETQIVKAFAIIAMLTHHLFYEHAEFGSTVVSIGIIGKICVFLFVFLSGYGMAASFPQNLSGKFKSLLRRKLREHPRRGVNEKSSNKRYVFQS